MLVLRSDRASVSLLADPNSTLRAAYILSSMRPCVKPAVQTCSMEPMGALKRLYPVFVGSQIDLYQADGTDSAGATSKDLSAIAASFHFRTRRFDRNARGL
jgi:hypothetical protein